MHRLAKLSLTNRSVVALGTAIIAVFGFISLGSLRQELFPSLEVPQAAIVATYPGASPDVVDNQVSEPIEAAVRALDGVDSTSTTSQNNLSIVRVSFEYGTTTAQVKERLNGALAGLSSLPGTVTPKILSGSLDSIPVIVLGISADSGNNASISQALEDNATPMFSAVNGVRDVSVSGTVGKRINLTLKDSVLKANGLSQQSIVSALQANGVVIPAGSIVDSKGQLVIQVGSPVESLQDFKNLPLSATSTGSSGGSLANLFGGGSSSGIPSGSGMPSGLPTGLPTTMPTGGTGSGSSGSTGGITTPSTTPSVTSTIKVFKVSQVAKVELIDSPDASISRVNGKPALSVALTKTQDGNTVSISHDVEKLIPELKAKLGAVTVTTVFDQAPFVEKSLENLTSEGLLGLGFAILVILIFLLSIRSTIVTAISIPTSVLITFIGLNYSGYSMNLFTLSALTIAIGRVVDDSIVVIENINRHLSYGEEKKAAILNAVREVASAITAATITTIAVFLPIALVGGLVGQLFRPFALTFAIALAASLLVSLTIVPVLAYWFLKSPNSQTPVDAAKVREEEEAKERKSWLQRGYLPVLHSTQKHPVLTLISAGFVLLLTFGMVPLLKTNFIGNSESTTFVLVQELDPGATMAEKDKAAAKLESIVLSRKGIEVVQTSIGSTGDGRVAFGAAAGGTQLQISTIEGLDQVALQQGILDEAAKDSSMGTVKLQGSGGGGNFGSSDTIDIKIVGTNDASLKAGIVAVTEAMQGTKDVSEITNSLAVEQRTLKIQVDRLKAAKYGLTEVAVSGIVASTLNPSSIGKLNLDSVSTPIYVVKTDTPKTLSAIRKIAIPTASGAVSLSSIAKLSEVNEPVSVTREKGDPTAKVMLKPTGDNLGAITTDVTKRLNSLELPAGATASIGGVSKDQADSFAQLGLALLAAIAIVYLVMVATFRSIVQPIVLLTSIPFAATGAFVALLVSNTALGVPALIGMLLLVGIVVTNAIVLIDLMNQYREQGMELREAILNGARQRLRPILMTALATIFALTPMGLGLTGGGGFISQPLAVVVIGGLFSSTVLTLVIVPVLYQLVEARGERKARRKAKRAQRKQGKSAAKLQSA